MVMITPQYEGFYGSVERVGKGSVQTLFYHFAGLPIFPQESYWVEGSDAFSWSNLKVMELGRSWPSIIAGYLRGWTTVGSLYLLVAGVGLWFVPQGAFPGDPMPLGHTILSPALAALGVLGAMAAVVTWFLTRRPVQGDEAARRAIFEQFTGVPIDPALLRDVSMSLRGGQLKNDLVQAAHRAGLGRHEDLLARWQEVARDARMASPEVLKLALTVARFELGKSTDAGDRARLAQLEQELWQRLVGLDPSVRGLQPVAA